MFSKSAFAEFRLLSVNSIGLGCSMQMHGSGMRREDRPAVASMPSLLFLAAAAIMCASATALVALSLANAGAGTANSKAAWDKHRGRDSETTRNSLSSRPFSRIRGRVTDEAGRPVAKALVRCVSVDSLVQLARSGSSTAPQWRIPIEDETATNEDGAYEFEHLSVGARTFFYSAPGRDLAPAVKDLIIVQDGLGAQLDVTLERPATLLVRLGWTPTKPRVRFHLVPHRWWPSTIAAVMAPGATSIEFRGLGGPFRQGLIAVSDLDETSPLRVVDRYDLSRATTAALIRPGPSASQLDLSEAAGFEPWQEPSTAGHRQFYAAVSPIALFWPEVSNERSSGSVLAGPLLTGSALAVHTPSFAKPAATELATAQGFGPHAFLPVLAESRAGNTWLTWTNDASEFEFANLPSGYYRIRAGPVW